MAERVFLAWETQIAIWGYAIMGNVLEPDAVRCEKPFGEPWDRSESWLWTWQDENGHHAPERWALSDMECEARRRFLTWKPEVVDA